MWKKSDMDEPRANYAARLSGALRESAFTAVIAFGLFLPLVGFNTVQNIRNELVLETRWPLLLSLVAVIAAVRFFQLLLVGPSQGGRTARGRTKTTSGTLQSRAGSALMLLTLAFAALYPVLALSLAGLQGAAKWID